MAYFERQHSRDCSVHSLNNAVGYQAITPSEVLDSVNERAADFAKRNGYGLMDEKVQKFRDRLADHGSFFAADAVWRAAQELGRIGPVVNVPGFGGKFSRVSMLPQWARENASVVVLGLAPGNRMHAIAIRDGLIYDSVKERPKPLTDKELARSLTKIFAAYVVQKPGTRASYIKRTQPLSISN